jgi:hypothetical protein
MRDAAARLVAVIRIDAIWLAVEPMDMRAGSDTALARVVKVVGAARPHHAYVFANRRGNRMKVLIHDGIGVWLAARRLNKGRFVWPEQGLAVTQTLTPEQLQALVVGVPWQRMGEDGVINCAVTAPRAARAMGYCANGQAHPCSGKLRPHDSPPA